MVPKIHLNKSKASDFMQAMTLETGTVPLCSKKNDCIRIQKTISRQDVKIYP